jgi:hypothetical protein
MVIMQTLLFVIHTMTLRFADELIEKLGWKEGDVLQWIDNKDGSFSLVKPEAVPMQKFNSSLMLHSLPHMVVDLVLL